MPDPAINQISTTSLTWEIKIATAANNADSVHSETAAFLRDKPARINRWDRWSWPPWNGEICLLILERTATDVSRIKRHISPFQGGQDHLSHRLIRAGLSRRKAAVSLWTLSALFASVAILISKVSETVENWLIAGSALFWIILFILFFKSKDA